MRLKARDWPHDLRTDRPCYGIFSDEPLLLAETEKEILGYWQRAGFDQRQRITGENQWGRLREERDSLSLFAERRVVILRLDDLRPGKEAASSLAFWLQSPPAETRLLVLGPRPDAQAQKLKWFQELDQSTRCGVLLLYPPETRHWPRWIAQRLQSAQVAASSEAIADLAQRTEGNLAAAEQAIRRFAELFPGQSLTSQDLPELLGDSAQFSIFDLSEAVLAGDPNRIIRTLRRLQQNEAEPILLLWTLHRDIVLLLQLQDGSPEEILRRERIFPPRSEALLAAARRIPRQHLLESLSFCGQIDARIKGQDPRPFWPALADLALQFAAHGLAGHNIPSLQWPVAKENTP
ncbi:MAG: DNA polymerase III subunit delta [Acidithiobacillus sp.]|nr:DNA polymerase III subunit delta [Acidithiobacillus sp.]